jgi:hypothetical protein
MAPDFEGYEMVDSRPEFELFDLTKRDIAELEINRSYHGNCCLIDKGGTYYRGFILNTKSDGTTSVCEVTFHPSSKSGLYMPRLTFTKQKSGDIKDSIKPKVRIAFDGSDEGVEEFWKMVNFLLSFKEFVDIGEFQKRYTAIGVDEVVLRLSGLPEAERAKEVAVYAARAGIGIEDIAEATIHTNRKATLKVFNDLLNKAGYADGVYRVEHAIKGIGEEAIWHHFLKENEWILGLNLNIRFIEDFTNEVSVGNPNTENRENPKVDLMGISDYTVLVELKTSRTDVFTPSRLKTARAGTWSFTSEFIDGFSQCLAQKFDWDKEAEGKDLVSEGEILDQTKYRTLDPKVIFIIGNKESEFPFESKSVDHVIKRDTFERFRRNNRNVEILTYDELYQRANFIVNGKGDKGIEKA